ncbi:hypothetical protein M3Y94_00012300 [Aphelenchoides besseyi]|nr:hypothetical protein M3Y94_00012300 [Aphelenchoides besseyi]KAI6216823.1 hypothetical protein M3Y95_01255000 [Aphelenchoides besseyi]
MKIASFFLLFVSVYAKIDVHFSSALYGISVDISIGTPAQDLLLRIFNTNSWPSVVLADRNHFPHGFNPNVSSTFQSTGSYSSGFTGTDRFTIDYQLLNQNPPLRIVEDFWFDDHDGIFGLARPTDGSVSFLDVVLSPMDEKVVSFSYDRLREGWSTFTGIMSIGSKQNERCANDWFLIPEATAEEQWSMKVDEFSMGKYTYDQPGVTSVSLDSKFYLPQKYQTQLLQLLDAESVDSVPCNTTLKFVLTVGDHEFRIGPNDYVDHFGEGRFGTCSLHLDFSSDDEFVLPSTIFYDYCILFDYAGLNLGFATRL